MTTPLFTEDHVSQIPALQMLINMGYEYLTPDKANKLRDNKTSLVLLESILKKQLESINSFERKGQKHKFSDSNISSAIQTIKDLPIQNGYIEANKYLYDLLILGKSFEETIDGVKKSHNIKFIDWENLDNNVFHVTEEYSVKREGSEKHYRPDIVLFINGIPIVVIECKSPAVKGNKSPNELAQEQHLRNQKKDGIRSLYIYSQILISIASDLDCSYATTGTSKEYWGVWREQFRNNVNLYGYSEDVYNETLSNLKNIPLKPEEKSELFSDRFKYVREYFDSLESEERRVTEQDKLLFNLCSKPRIFDLIRNFIVYDEGIKKIALYQQYFVIKNTMLRISKFDNTGRRAGGTIWHTQGSGKSLTMVMMAQMIALSDIPNPKIILVTDRVDLDKQIKTTFHNCGKDVVRATTGSKLTEYLTTNNDSVITTVINKFEAAVNQIKHPLISTEIFVMIDEGHRTQYGAFNVNMQRVFPNACFISFTGTPLMKKEKNTAEKFGGFIGNPYTVLQAVEDGAVVPILYEGRHNRYKVDESPINRLFEKITEYQTEENKAKLKQRFNSKQQLNQADQIIIERAWDISDHYSEFFQTHGHKYKPKAMLVAPSIKAALKYKMYLDEIGKVNSEVVVSQTDQREGSTDAYESNNEDKKREEDFFNAMIDKYGKLETYEDSVISRYKYEDIPEIIIVVAKLLTGFDAPATTILYLCRSLREHTLLQAIARVNRNYPGKDYGYIIDYYGNLENLDDAIGLYSNLEGFDPNDLKGSITNISEELKKLPQAHSNLWDIFKTIKGKTVEVTRYEEILFDDKVRDDFYERLSVFSRLLKMALSSYNFISNTDDNIVRLYKDDAKFFLKLRVNVKRRYNDEISFKEYEPQIQKLIDKHISTEGEIEKITDLIDVFDNEERQAEVEKLTGNAAKADHIATKTLKQVNLKLEEDPIYYKKFADLIKETIADYHQQRIDELYYLQTVKKFQKEFREGRKDGIPDSLIGNDSAISFFNQSKTIFSDINVEESDFHEKVSLIVNDVILNNIYHNNIKVIDWKNNHNIISKIKLDAGDEIYEFYKKFKYDVKWDKIDELIDECLKIAKLKYE